jgi:hypothetical protein
MAAIPFRVVSLAEGLSEYRELAKAYWKWIHGPDPDANPRHPTDPNLTFLRDDVIGSQLQHEVGILLDGRGKSELAPFDTQPITAPTSMNFFFPIYHVCSASEHPYVKGGKCDSAVKRKNAAMFDLNNNYQKWAKITIGSEPERNIVDNLDNYNIETGEFELEVPGTNNLNREAGFNLPPGNYPAFAAGTYLYLKNLQPGNYRLDFGGRATDFHTQSVYNIALK